MDPLQILPVVKWSSLRETLKRDWPIYAYHYNWLGNAMKWIKKDPELSLEIFCPNGQYESGVFVAISSFSEYMILIFAFEESKDTLRKALLETKVIDWSNDILFRTTHQSFLHEFLEVLYQMKEIRNIQIHSITETKCYFKSKEECTKIDFQVPAECYLGHLNETEIPFINSLWPLRSTKQPESTIKLLKTTVRLNCCIGLYLKESDSLVSWILLDDWGSLGVLQTVDGHKCKGYGRVVLQAIMRELAEKEHLDCTLFVKENNIPAVKLYDSLGYERLVTACRIHVGPIQN